MVPTRHQLRDVQAALRQDIERLKAGPRICRHRAGADPRRGGGAGARRAAAAPPPPAHHGGVNREMQKSLSDAPRRRRRPGRGRDRRAARGDRGVAARRRASAPCRSSRRNSATSPGSACRATARRDFHRDRRTAGWSSRRATTRRTPARCARSCGLADLTLVEPKTRGPISSRGSISTTRATANRRWSGQGQIGRRLAEVIVGKRRDRLGRRQ